MKLIVVYTYGEPYEVGYHDCITPVEYESAEKLYCDICESFNKKDYPVSLNGYTPSGCELDFYLEKESFDSLRVYTLDEFWEVYQP